MTTQFVINIYYDEALGEQVCTCCRSCEGWRYVPGAQLFAVCAGPAAGLRLAAGAERRVRRGNKARYMLRITNTPAYEGMGIRVVLPPDVYYVRSKVKPSLGFTKRPRWASPTVNGSILEFPVVPMPAGFKRKFKVKVRVRPQAPVGVPLVFSAYAYQTLPSGQPFCDTYANNVTTRVIR